MARKQQIREYVYVFMAACPGTGESTSLVLPYVNIDTMQIFIDQVAKDFPNYLIVMQLDGASWHTSEKLNIPENIRLVHQPPHSPEVNPIEDIWDYVKENDFRNKYFASIKRVEEQLCRSLEKLRKMPNLIKSITAFPHLLLCI